MITIDGSEGEGGGQLLRTSLAFGQLLHKSVKITKIRESRPKPGLARQHLSSIKALTSLCNGTLIDSSTNGAVPVKVGTASFDFIPGEVDTNSRVNTVEPEGGGAGSITLMIQTMLPSLLMCFLSPNLMINQEEAVVFNYKFKGGTDVMASPPIAHVSLMLVPFLKRLGAPVLDIDLKHSGYFPVGGGLVQLKVQALELPLDLSKQLPPLFDATAVEACALHIGFSGLSEISADTLVFMEKTAKQFFTEVLTCTKNVPIHFLPHAKPELNKKRKKQSISTGCVVVLEYSNGVRHYAHREEFQLSDFRSMLYDTIATLWRSNATLDEYTADQIVIYIAVTLFYTRNDCEATNSFTATLPPRDTKSSLHLETVLMLVHKFFPGISGRLEEMGAEHGNARRLHLVRHAPQEPA